ncbi:MAG: translocation/assembly module TamB domain-containing protein [Deltaproteobacteria bacterium]|nr:translocation/assembly module TamB domain-containing protein [Deltaproteobacteria bacterium]
MPESNTDMKKRPPRVRWLRWLFLSVIGVIIFIGLVWAGFQTRWAKDRLAGLVATATAGTDGYRVILQGVDGWLPFSILIDRVTLSDENGEWLEGRQVDISLNWAPLLAGILDVEWFRMEGLSISRLPETVEAFSEKEPVDQEPLSFSLPRVRVREIRIPRIDLAKAVVGEPLSYTLQSNARTGDRQMEISGLLQSLDHPNNALRLTAAYDLNTRRISTDLSYRESTGGLVTGLMGLPDAAGIVFRLKAEGPLSKVEGDLDLEIGGYGKAGMKVEAGIDDPVTLIVDGQVRAEHRMVPEKVTAALGGLRLDIRCRAAISSDKMFRITAFTAKAQSTAVSVEGTADLARGLMNLQATVSPVDISPFLQGSGLEYRAVGPVHLTAKGPFSQPEVTAAVPLGRLRIRDTALKEIILEARAAFETDHRGLKKSGASITIEEVEFPQVPALRGPLRVDIIAASPDFRKWDIENLQLTAPEIALSARDARIDTMSGDFSADLLTELNRLGALMPPKAGEIDGRLVILAKAEGNITTQQIKADLNMALTRLSGLPSMAAEVVGPEQTLNAHASMKEGILALEEAHMTGGHTDLKADGRLNMEKGTFDVNYHLLLKDLSKMAGTMGVRLSGEVETRGRMSGEFEDFAADMALSSERLQVNDLILKALRTQLKAEGLPGKPSGSFRVNGAALDQPFQLSAGFSWSDETLALSGAKAALPGIDLYADIGITPGTRNYTGTAGGTIRSLELLGAIAGIPAEGSGNFQLTAGDAAATLNADFKDLRYKDHGIALLRITAQMDDMATLRGRISMEATDAAVRDARLETVKLDVNGTLDKAAATLEAKGSVGSPEVGRDGSSDAPLSLFARLHMTHEDMWRFRLEKFDALYRELDVALAHPAIVTLQDQKLTLDGLQLHTAKGDLHAGVALTPETVQAFARITDLPLAMLAPVIGLDLIGTVSAKCDISGPLTDPAMHGEAHIRDYRIPRGEGKAPLLLKADLTVDRRGDRLEADLTLSGLDKSPFIARASLPVRLSLKPFDFKLDTTGDLDGRLQGHLDLAIFRGLPIMVDQTLRGEIDVDIGLGGSVEKWALNGGLTIQNGRFENPASGTILADINGRITADGRSLRLTRLTAIDGEKGTVALEGGITTEAPFPLDADLTFNQATLLRKKILTSSASGKVDVKGTPKRLDLTGNIVLDRTEVAIPKRLPPDVVEIPVTEINLPPGMSTGGAGPLPGSSLLFMDLSLQIPARFFVRGRGLDAEFQGQLTAQGPAYDPVIQGTLHVVRGTFQFLSRTFHITQGQIVFEGATPPNPFLNITTQVTAGQIDARVRVTGPADAFKMTLTSQPPLPQDEIMANILFGQSVAKLNAFQAYQLATAISQLSGGDMPDIAGRTRSLLHVDRLSISGGDDTNRSDGGPTISAGKYVSEDVYVGVEQELTDAKQDVIVEVDITPNFSVQSKAGTRSGAGIGFNWKFDY